MKNYKLVNSGKNGNLYYAMSSALDGLKGLLEFADRIYVIDQGKNLIWTGSELVEDKNPESGSESSDEGSGGSGGSEPLMVTIAVSYDADSGDTTYTCNKTWQEIHDAYPNVILSATTTNDEEVTLEEMGLVYEVIKATLPDNSNIYAITHTLDLSERRLIASSSDGYPSATGGGLG